MNAPAAFPAVAEADLPDWPRLMRAELAARYLGVGVTLLREDGPQPKRWRGRVLWDRADLDRFADALGGLPLDADQRAAEGDDMLARIQGRLASQGT